jgi:hypothetical protein
MNRSYESYSTGGIEKKFRNLENRITEDVVRRVKKTKTITSSADYQLNRYYILGNSTQDIENIIKSAVGDDFPETWELYDEVVEKQYTRSKYLYEQVNQKFIPYEENSKLKQIVDTLIRQSNEELFNITKSMGFMVDMGGKKVFTPLSEYYNEYLDNAMVEITSGAFDYNSVIRRVVGQMTNSGLRTVEYASGRTARCDVAARRAIMTGLSQLSGHISDTNAQRLGTEYFEIDWHSGARPEHRAWQGKVWSREQLTTVCGYGTVTGLLGANCYHEYYPFLPGISERNYTDSWLEEQNRKEDKPRTFKGREYTLYEATQRQRYLETNMRAQRQKVLLLKEAGADADTIMLARCKYQAQLDGYKAFSKKMGLPEQRERIYYDLQGRVASSRETYQKWQDEKKHKERGQGKQKPIAKNADSGIMISGARITDPLSEEAEAFAKMYYREIRSFSTDVRKIADNLGKNESDIRKIKEYLFGDNSFWDSDTRTSRAFDPDCAIAQSWQRLMIGQNIQPHDRTLIEHELLEMQIKRENPEIEHWKAHELAAQKYNYPKEADEYYGNLEKYNKDKR